MLTRTTVISLRSRPERRLRFFAGLPADWPFPQPEVFDALDGTKLRPPTWWNNLQNMYACNESHRAVLARALSDGVDRLLVMEDDCGFVEGAGERMLDAIDALPDDWQCLMFGGQTTLQGTRTPVEGRPGLLRVTQTQRMHCYYLHAEGMRAVHQLLSEPVPDPCDYRLADWQETAPVYLADPIIAYQYDGLSSLSGAVEPSRTWDAKVPRPVRAAADVPIVALACPHAVFNELRAAGLACNGLAYAHYLWAASERIGVRERQLADLWLAVSRLEPERMTEMARGLRSEAAHWPEAAVTLWHPTEQIYCHGVEFIRSDSFEHAARHLRRITGQHSAVSSPAGTVAGGAHLPVLS